MSEELGPDRSAFWDAWWRREARPQSSWMETDDHSNEIAFIRRSCASVPQGLVAEIGCGSGKLLLRYTQAFGGFPVAVDDSEDALSHAQAQAQVIRSTVALVSADALSLPFASQSFATVLSGGLLEHFADPAPVLVEMCRILKPGGLFYADVVPRKFSLWRMREWPRMRRSSQMAPGVFESDLGPSYYRTLLHALGMKSIKTRWEGVYWIYRGDRFVTKLKRVLRPLDGTPVAAWLGWYFMISAVKPVP